MIDLIKQQEVLGQTLKFYGDWTTPLFLAKEVAEWIEHSDVSKMVRSVDEDEKVQNIVPTLGGEQKAWFLTEDGLYEVLMQSRKPIAKEFKKQVKAILKEVRTTGHFQRAQHSTVKPCHEVSEVESIFRFMADPKGHMQRKMSEKAR